MKMFSIKLLVGLSNIIMYIALILLFLAFGFTNFNLPHRTTSAICIALFSISVVIFILYQFLRKKNQAASEFQLLYKHIIMNRIFYIIQYIAFAVFFIYIMLLRYHVIVGEQNRIYFYVTFPIIFVATSFGSVLESIVRVEERIFLNKKAWKDSEEFNKNKKNKTDQPISTDKLKQNTKANPFSTPLKQHQPVKNRKTKLKYYEIK